MMIVVQTKNGVSVYLIPPERQHIFVIHTIKNIKRHRRRWKRTKGLLYWIRNNKIK
jgi:hypothetical protein